ncbi:hypothetical protein Q5752_003982 [Cryptotrichosporon argae]
MAPTWNAYYALLLLPALALLRRPAPPSRETLLPPADERVLLLGASSGIGRDLAHAYARRGARVCLVARRADALEEVRNELVALGLRADRVLVVPADVTSTADLLDVRARVAAAWGGFDTLHILAGVPSTSTLMQIAGVDLSAAQPAPAPSTSSAATSPPTARRAFSDAAQPFLLAHEVPTAAGLDALAAEARALSEINYVGTVLALACFLPLLASASPSPAVHHLSSVAATIPAPRRALYSATKAAALMAVEACRVECAGAGVRFFSLLPGTIDNGFRHKTATSASGGHCEVAAGTTQWGQSLLLAPAAVVAAVLAEHARPTSPSPWFPIPPFDRLRALDAPPHAVRHLPFVYRLVTVLNLWGPTRAYVERSARKKYGLQP